MKTQREYVMDYCKEQNLSLKDFATELNISYGSLKTAFSTYSIKGMRAILIARKINVDLETFLLAPFKKKNNN